MNRRELLQLVGSAFAGSKLQLNTERSEDYEEEHPEDAPTFPYPEVYNNQRIGIINSQYVEGPAEILDYRVFSNHFSGNVTPFILGEWEQQLEPRFLQIKSGMIFIFDSNRRVIVDKNQKFFLAIPPQAECTITYRQL